MVIKSPTREGVVIDEVSLMKKCLHKGPLPPTLYK
ncbi:hypothetical protein PL2TA16_01828 [Pseudoalteromonas luteoviolacea 2ta16]|uniref:Uncharacterized protein n=1 Tax=Pseudoalteromonas luteoviolacea (strain 2ta16) TaxID=1353533 RepID=V4HS17_PSEL2|nr:hypothetical protein PL2TA16_01828 [Pseudoalteromonas luteoviolacea 2ta16]